MLLLGKPPKDATQTADEAIEPTEKPEKSHSPPTKSKVIENSLENKEHPPWWDMAGLQAWEEGERFIKQKREGLTIAEIAEKEALEPQFIRNCLQCLPLPKDYLAECTLGEALEERRRREPVSQNPTLSNEITAGGSVVSPETESPDESTGDRHQDEQLTNPGQDRFVETIKAAFNEEGRCLEIIHVPLGSVPQLKIEPGKMVLLVPGLAQGAVTV